MGFTKKFNQDFMLENNQLKLSSNYLLSNVNKFKKITGSRFASILGLNNFASPFKTWCIMTNIFVDEIDETLTKAGSVIEPKIHKYICDKLGINFMQYDPKKIQWDVFKENKIFGGIPDGEPIDDKGNLLYPNEPMLEIKTTSIDSFVYKKVGNNFILEKDNQGNPIVKNKNEKKMKWFKNDGNIIIPTEYMFQLGLYCYLRNTNDGVFAICFLETNDYVEPEKCNILDRDIRIVKFKLDRSDFERFIKYGEQWYKDYIEKGISPKMSKNDIEWFNNEVK